MRRHILLFDYRSNGGDNNGWGVLVKVIRLDNQNRSFSALNTAFAIAKIVEEDVSTLDIQFLIHCSNPFMFRDVKRSFYPDSNNPFTS